MHSYRLFTVTVAHPYSLLLAPYLPYLPYHRDSDGDDGDDGDGDDDVLRHTTHT